jgi:hypothetical protein
MRRVDARDAVADRGAGLLDLVAVAADLVRRQHGDRLHEPGVDVLGDQGVSGHDALLWLQSSA